MRAHMRDDRHVKIYPFYNVHFRVYPNCEYAPHIQRIEIVFKFELNLR